MNSMAGLRKCWIVRGCDFASGLGTLADRSFRRLTWWTSGGGTGAALAGENLRKLVELMAHLRGPQGCPWDREQDYDSVKGLLLEETYEVIDAVNAHDYSALQEELGDLLFQVVFYSRLAEEENRFTIDDVIEQVHAKLIRRHPHVFGEVRARNAEEALKSWLAVKEQERQSASQGRLERDAPATAGGTPALPEEEAPATVGRTPALPQSLLDGLSSTFPATLEAYELGLRASEVGFDWTKTEDLLDKIGEELQELRHELAARPEARRARLEEEVGDLLFAAANLARFLRSDPESCLRRANQKFKQRFQALEQEVARHGKRLRDCNLEEMELLWNELKARESQ
jgi:nucleoside triphosphate diphosphatase